MLKYNPENRVKDIIKNQILDLPELQHQLSKNAISYLRERVFLGQCQPYTQRTSSGRLTSMQIQTICKLNILCYQESYYHRGLINAATKNNKPIDVIALHDYIYAQLTLIVANPRSEISNDSQALLRGLKLSRRAQIALLNQRNGLSEILQREQQLQLAQLGTLILPPALLTILREPVHFVDTTATALGRLAEVVLRQGIKCQVSTTTNSFISELLASCVH